MLDGGEQGAGQGFDGQGIRARDLDEFAKLYGLLGFELLGLGHKGLEFGVVVAGLAGHDMSGAGEGA